ncbi:winged helix-turn-helix transcriptional regulator [Candidatus Woesearchaeota archaeon]|nr:winged helix-turn-helix transcriptional regulator [Candidatus Woesearchaeota archaeon]
MVTKVSIWLTLEPLLYSRPKHLAEISRELKKPHTTVRKQLKIFEKKGLIQKERIGKQTFYKLKKIPLIIDYLAMVEKEKLIEKCEKELVLKEIVEFLHNFDNTILIFGSAVDSVKEARDIDLLVIGRFNKREIELLGEKLNVRFHLINVRNLKEINESLKQEIRNKHLIINNAEALIKWLIS